MSTHPRHTTAGRARGLDPVAWRLAAWVLMLCAAPFVRAQETQPGASPSLFRRGFSSSLFKEMNENDIKIFLRKLKKIVAGATTLHQTSGGQQLQTIFKVDRLEAHPASCLDSARELLALHQRLCGGTNQVAVSGTSVPAGQANGGGN